MIVWGGVGAGAIFSNTGGRYNPSTDSWTATSTTGAPTARGFHTVVGSGCDMIVWGGIDSAGPLNTGARYNLCTGNWSETSTTNAPEARFYHTAVWTGIEMIVWAGEGDLFVQLNTGGRYNPNT